MACIFTEQFVYETDYVIYFWKKKITNSILLTNFMWLHFLQQNHWTTYRNGLFSGIFLVAIVIALVAGKNSI